MNASAKGGTTTSVSQLPDLLAEDLRVLFCGINPAATAARSGHHFSSGSNRFWRVLHLAGFTPHLIPPDKDSEILQHGYGLTAVVSRPTVRASDVSRHEFAAAAEGFEQKVRLYRPRKLAFLGKPAFAALFKANSVSWGLQTVRFGGAEVWVVPNPSGLNRTFSVADLVAAYRELRVASERCG